MTRLNNFSPPSQCDERARAPAYAIIKDHIHAFLSLEQITFYMKGKYAKLEFMNFYLSTTDVLASADDDLVGHKID